MTARSTPGSGTARLVLASNNPGKIEELRALLPAWVSVESAREAGVELPEETESTFAGNALLKARAAACQTGQIAVADDSGLEVAALDGAPGVRSARFAGEPTSDDANNALLLERLAGVPADRRGARFRSAVAVVLPGGREHVAEGDIAGTILEQPRGAGGFGYDPLFQPVGNTRSMAELSIEEKNRISHRGKALRAAAEWLLPILEAATGDTEPIRGRLADRSDKNGDQV